MFFSQALTATPIEVLEVGDFFRINESSDYFDVRVIFYANGVEISRVLGVGAGYSEKFSKPFDKIWIYAPLGCAVFKFVTRLGGDVRYDTPPTGLVTVANVGGSIAGTQRTVTTSSSQISAGFATRRYLLVQNKDATGNIWINFGAAAATTANGLKIGPGQSWTADSSWCYIGQVQAIGDIASNANILVVEG